MTIIKVISGGQTGVDRAALDCALALGIPCGGWCPKGRLAEDGPIPLCYPLIETPSGHYAQRTEWNVRDADGTFIVTYGPLTGGTLFTVECAQRLAKPYLLAELESECPRDRFVAWLQQYQIHTLNIAGPRGSHKPGTIYRRTEQMLMTLLLELIS